MTDESIFDPFERDHYEDPYARLAQLRDACPVTLVGRGAAFVATDELTRVVLRDYSQYSNEGNFVLECEAVEDEPPNVVQLDPPRHSTMRRLLLRAFSPESVARSEGFVRKVAHELVERIVPARRADLIEAFAVPLPMTVLTSLVGVPAEDAEQFKRWTTEITANLPENFRHLSSWPEFKAYLQDQIDARRARPDPPDDILTRLLQARVDGEALSDPEIRMAVFQLIVAGYETTTHLIGNCVNELLRNGLWSQLEADRALVPVAIEESLRHDAPIEWAMRTVAVDSELGQVELRPGQRVLVGLGSANRDPARFADPDTFSLDRPDPGDHVAFGLGIHLCLGAALARLEARIALEALLESFPDLALAPGTRFERGPSPMLRGPVRLDVAW